jgi:site-specific DNA-methyltransferase (cytosine-N4-specific)
VLTFSNTRAGDVYQNYCRENKLKPHPARMPQELPEFFIKLLTREGDFVMDPFAGSNTTGAVAQRLKRKWIAVEAMEEYVVSSQSRFMRRKVDLNDTQRAPKSSAKSRNGSGG